MFEDLTANDIISAIKSADKNNNHRDTQYGLWFEEKTYSPAGIITEVYKLRNQPIDRRSFNTDEAQKRLLELGFPIVEIDVDFFSIKEMESYIQLIQRPEYDHKSLVDINIGKFLNKVIWEKTRYWAKGLEEKGWIIEGAKNWNEQDIKGQRYKKYTWYKVFPEKQDHPLLFFTIGIHSNGSLIYKLDIQQKDSFFTKERKDFFSNERKARNLWIEIDTSKIVNYSWDTLIEESHSFFNSCLNDYLYLKNNFWPSSKRLMRLTWNTNNWEFPSGHSWKKSNQGKTNIAYENQYGYGHEEWLLNDRYRINDYQYGYIRGIEHMSQDDYLLDKTILFSIDPDSKERFLIGEINSVEIIEGIEQEIKKIKPQFDCFQDTMLEELKEVNADYKHFKTEGFIPNVKFHWDDIIIFNQPIPSEFLKSDKFTRFQPYKIDDEIDKSLKDDIEKTSRLIFKPGKASSKDSYKKKTDSKTSTVTRKHTKISEDLYDYFIKIKGISEESLSVEKTYVGGSCIDVAIKDGEELSILEIKTSSVGLRNIRYALGQIFEYAFLDDTVRIKELVIVGPAKLRKEEIDYFQRINNIISIPLQYWYYNASNELKDRFIKL